MTFLSYGDFWSWLVLSVADTEPVVRHALYALSELHEQFLSDRGSRGRESRFALRQYNTAIRLLRHDTGSSSPLVYLLCCLIFVSIEVRRNA